MALGTVSGLLVTSTVILLFAAALLNDNLTVLIAVIFSAAMLTLTGSLLVFFNRGPLRDQQPAHRRPKAGLNCPNSGHCPGLAQDNRQIGCPLGRPKTVDRVFYGLRHSSRVIFAALSKPPKSS